MNLTCLVRLCGCSGMPSLSWVGLGRGRLGVRLLDLLALLGWLG